MRAGWTRGGRDPGRRRSATAKAALAIGLLLTALAGAIVFVQARSSAREFAELNASDLADSLKQRLGLANAYLRATAGRMRGSAPPSDAQFVDFATSLGPQPVADALFWLPVVRGDERRVFERLFLRERGGTIRDLGGHEPPAAASGDVHQPAAYFAGSDELAFLAGTDFLTHPALLATTTRASTTGQASLSPAIRVGEERFVVVLLPEEPGRQSEGGQQPLVGAALLLDSLVARARARAPVAPATRISDVTDPSRPVPLAGNATLADTTALVTARVPLAGRVWEVGVGVSYGEAYAYLALTLLGGFILTGLGTLVAERSHNLLIADDLKREVDRQTAMLRRSTAEFRALFEEGGAGKCELVPGNGHFRRVNLRLCEMLGIERDQLENMAFRDILVPGNGGSEDPALEALLHGKSDSYFAERRFRTSAGEELWGEVSATVLRDEEGRAIWIVAVVQDVTTRKEAEEARQLLVRELAHRVKNTLQLARSLADQTARYAADLPAFMGLYQSRLSALATAHDQLFKTNWAGADLADLVRATLQPYGNEAGDRIEIQVPHHRLSSAETQTVALLINELATNASKYGALSNGAGRIEIEASIAGEPRSSEDGETLIFNWREDAGRPVDEPSRRGFGMTFLMRAVAHQHDGTADVQWLERGPCYRFAIPLQTPERDDSASAA